MGVQGERFGSYRLISRLGRGGMGETWRAVRDDGHGVTKDVVIKRILRSVSGDPRFVEAFVSEARLSARLSHGNVAQVFEFGEVDGEHFMALEFVLGQPLQQAIDRAAKQGLRGLPPPFALYVMMEVLKGLHHAHQRLGPDGKPLQIVHRDVSPDNVLVSYEGEVKVVDFGIAKAQYTGRAETEPGVVKGKYNYFSPEQATAEAVDARSDVYSAGVVLYELLAGRLPIEGQAHVVLRKLLTGEYPRLGVTAPWLPEGLVEAVDRATRAKKEDRFDSALQFQQAIAEELRKLRSDVSQVTVSGMMTSLFGPELSALGRTVVVPAAVQAMIEAHRQATRRFPREPVSQLSPAPAPITAEARPATAPAPPPTAPAGRPAWQWAVTGSMVVAGLLATFLLLDGRDPAPPVANAARVAVTLEEPAQPPPAEPPVTAPPPAATEKKSENITQVLLARGRSLVDSGKYAEARPVLLDCVEGDPNAFDCMYLLAMAYGLGGEQQEADVWIRKFAKLAPADHPDRPKVEAMLKKTRLPPMLMPRAPAKVIPSALALTSVEAQVLLAGQQMQIQRCVDEQHRREPGAKGSIEAHFDVQDDGKVVNMEVTPTGFSAPPQAMQCFAKVVGPFRFPRGRAAAGLVVPFRY